MSSEDTLFSPNDDKTFVQLVSEHLQKGAATKRGITAHQYIDLARQKWRSCKTDEVYILKILVDPLVQPELASELPEEWAACGDPFCELIAQMDANGDFVNAPAGYVPPSYPGVLLAHIVAGSPSGGIVPDPSKPTDYLFALLDVLGFGELLKRIGLDELIRRYRQLLASALAPQSESRPWGHAITLVKGEPTAGLMWLPIQAAYFSDSLLLWVHYHPGHVPEFLDRCSRVFCQALALGLPIRGAVSVGRAILHKTEGIYLGTPIVEAARLESNSNWIGVALCASWKSESLPIPIPPDRVFVYEPPLKDGGKSLFSGLVLDWPRVWRESRRDSAVDHLRELCLQELPDELKLRYHSAINFCEHSQANQDWFLPPGAKRLRVSDLKAKPI
jgi:hypothetical protein